MATRRSSPATVPLTLINSARLIITHSFYQLRVRMKKCNGYRFGLGNKLDVYLFL